MKVQKIKQVQTKNNAGSEDECSEMMQAKKIRLFKKTTAGSQYNAILQEITDSPYNVYYPPMICTLTSRRLHCTLTSRRLPCTLTSRRLPCTLTSPFISYASFPRPLSDEQELSPGRDLVHADQPSTACLADLVSAVTFS
ncbi:hypothetical protein DPMN_068989 [Dreissena polymorpha]|uniref:Uncharacterized protein n=1 Tax=Dreissena polymorpha TaxID=45954 RepID=A0A9D3Z262_DREPO|nr:hypothetical protein DPMN_068989 [Dreissena polymorpha]